MKLSEIRKAYEDLSGTLSTSCRQLIFAGIGIAWMFIFQNRGLNGPSFLIKISLVTFILAFMTDIIQYTIQTWRWSHFYIKERDKHIKEHETINEDDITVLEPEESNKMSWFLFYLKIVFVVLAYVLLFVHIFGKLS